MAKRFTTIRPGILALVYLWAMSSAQAHAALRDVFGLNAFAVIPGSGQATSLDPIHIGFTGVAGTSLVPMDWEFKNQFKRITIDLSTPYELGATVFTPWSMDVDLPPLAAGTYDLYVRGITGAGGMYEYTTGPELLLADFVVRPALAGDFNDDHSVDQRDYEFWRDHYADGAMLAADYVVWRNNFGESSLQTSTATSAIPEPAISLLALLATAGFLTARER